MQQLMADSEAARGSIPPPVVIDPVKLREELASCTEFQKSARGLSRVSVAVMTHVDAGFRSDAHIQACNSKRLVCCAFARGAAAKLAEPD